jgi:L-alanine-DL-glutamate epimerase-like enolase superfamily enzyme
LTEVWRIAWLAYEHNTQCNPHGRNTAVGLADLHLGAAMPVVRYVEYLTPSPSLDEVITGAFVIGREGLPDDTR